MKNVCIAAVSMVAAFMPAAAFAQNIDDELSKALSMTDTTKEQENEYCKGLVIWPLAKNPENGHLLRISCLDNKVLEFQDKHACAIVSGDIAFYAERAAQFVDTGGFVIIDDYRDVLREYNKLARKYCPALQSKAPSTQALALAI